MDNKYRRGLNMAVNKTGDVEFWYNVSETHTIPLSFEYISHLVDREIPELIYKALQPNEE